MPQKSETILLVKRLLPAPQVRWPVLLFFWAFLGLLSALHWWFFYYGNQPYTWWVLLRAKLIVWSLWGAITPLILVIGARFRVERPHVFKHIATLVLISPVISIVYIGLYATAIYWNFPPEFPGAERGFMTLVHWIYWNHFAYFYLGFWITIAVEQMLSYASRSHKREMITKELERQLSEAHLQQLKSQIHPHFLFNTLNAVSSFIIESNKERAYDVVTRLSQLLRTGLQHGEKPFVSLLSEVEFCREYLTLMSVRYGDCLSFETNVESQHENWLVPSLILQPIVENAVKHGIGTLGEKSHIRITTTTRDGKLVVTVSNEALIVDEKQTIRETKDPAGFGIGLRNAEDRLRNLFGANYRLTISHPSPTMVSVELQLPEHNGKE